MGSPGPCGVMASGSLYNKLVAIFQYQGQLQYHNLAANDHRLRHPYSNPAKCHRLAELHISINLSFSLILSGRSCSRTNSKGPVHVIIFLVLCLTCPKGNKE